LNIASYMPDITVNEATCRNQMVVLEGADVLKNQRELHISKK